MTRPTRARRAAGFTLSELMISSALFGFVAAGAMTLVTTAARSQARAARVDIAQSGLRASFDFMTRDLLSASAGASAGSLTLGASGATVLPVNVTNSTTAPDKLDLYLVDPTAQATLLAPITATSVALTVDQTNNFSATDTLQVSDLANAMLVKVSSLGSGSFGIAPSALPSAVTSFAAGAYVFKSRHVTYAVASSQFGGTTGAANGSALTLDLNDGNGPQPLAEGVEDLQIALGFDNNGDGVITEVGSSPGDDEWTYNVAGESAPTSLTNLKLVRITLIAKSTQSEAGLQTNRPAAEDHAVGGGYDSFIRRVLRTEITVRNFNL